MITGASAGVISALIVAAIADSVPYERRGRAMGWVGMAYAVPVIAIPVAAKIAEVAGWRTIYLVFTFGASLVAVAVALLFDEAQIRTSGSSRSPGYLRIHEGPVDGGRGAVRLFCDWGTDRLLALSRCPFAHGSRSLLEQRQLCLFFEWPRGSVRRARGGAPVRSHWKNARRARGQYGDGRFSRCDPGDGGFRDVRGVGDGWSVPPRRA